MMTRKYPERSCIGCGTVREKRDLIRIVRSPEGEYSLDASGKKNGRGAYLCPRPECLARAMKTKALARSFGQALPDEVLGELRKELEELVKN